MKYICKKTLAVGIIVLFIVAGVYPSSGIILEEKSIMPTISGDTLYVGGDGPGNYTKIQDAIDNASRGDTVFVYDDSSPYIENIIVDKTISLIGEDRETTIIDGNKNGHVVFIIADGVAISGFTIKNGVGNIFGIGVNIKASYTLITDNIIRDNLWGIGIWHNNEEPHFIHQRNEISDNKIIFNSDDGLLMLDCRFSIIKNNIISNNGPNGIKMRYCNDNIITGNEINNNGGGIDMYQDCYRNDIYLNNFTSNRGTGISLLDVGNNNIFKNNFIGNLWRNINFKYSIRRIRKNSWHENYWDKPRTSPYLIFGRLYVEFWFLGLIPWFEIDWHPAMEPYDI